MTFRAKVRMYRQGLGDCFLVTLPHAGDRLFYILIDCGVILGTPGAAAKMQQVVEDIVATTGGHLDLLLATHEHWDHLSGFLLARDVFARLAIDQVWLAWTEDPHDELASQLRSEHSKVRLALTDASTRRCLSGTSDPALDGLMEFFGAAGQGSTQDALAVVKGFCRNPRYCRPCDPPVKPDGVDARFYVLGPPRSPDQIKRVNPSRQHPETYGVAPLTSGFPDADPDAPFDPIAQIPLEIAAGMPFFQSRYWGEDRDSEEKDQSWRRIDADCLDLSTGLALQLDHATNNSSLVLAIELGAGDVLLFAADAQLGSWLSWHELQWQVDGRQVTGPDLLRRTVLYKVGHHGSHNATLQQHGLQLMNRLQVALIPVDRAMALRKRWGGMPLHQLEKRLDEITQGAVLCVDKDVPEALLGRVTGKDLYYEVAI